MDYLFLKRTSRPDPVSAVLPPGFRLVFWRPGFRLRPWGFPARPFLLWGLWHRLKVYATPDYGMALIYEGAQLVHRTCLLPAHFRFPFMVRGDLQTAGIWTRPDRRGMGLALVALQGSLRRMADPERTLWYMVREDNQPSLRLAEKGGFQLFGRGRKLPSRAFGLLGAFQITEVHDGRPPQLPPRLPPTVPGMPIR
jgi:RimJ/RimL family protein N-acetyltransferase